MVSPLLALFGRSLREDSRVKSTYVMRVALVLITLFFLLIAKSEMGGSNAPGLSFFHTITIIDTIAILLSSVSYFASAITEEKEEMTLGLLRMTNLNPLSILLGKSTSRLCGALLLLAAQFPFTLLAIALGGIAMKQIVAAYCCLGAFLIFIANLALLASVICRRTAGAALLTGAVLVLFFVFVPLAGFIAQLPVQFGILSSSSAWVVGLESLAGYVLAASPFSRLSEAFRTGFQGSPGSFQVWSNLGMGIGCFFAAWLVFETFCGEQKESAPTRGVLPRRRSFLRFLGAGRPWRLPLAWKDFNFIAGGWLWVLIKFLIYSAISGGVYFFAFSFSFTGRQPQFNREAVGLLVFWISIVVLQFEIAFAAGSFFRNELQWQTLSSLAMLPRGMRWVAYQKALGLVPSLIPVLTFLAAGFLMLIPTLSHDFRRGNDMEFSALAFFFAQCVFFHHLVVNLSLRIKRGALPLSIGIQILLNMFGGTFAAYAFRGGNGSIAPFTGVVLFCAFCLHVDILKRLKTLAAVG